MVLPYIIQHVEIYVGNTVQTVAAPSMFLVGILGDWILLRNKGVISPNGKMALARIPKIEVLGAQ